MKKILILGTGAQGTTAAKLLDKDANVGELILADVDAKAVETLAGELTKAKGVIVDAGSVDSIVEVAEGVDLIINALPMAFGQNVLEAALKVKTNYQDFAPPTTICEDYADGLEVLYNDYGRRFREIGKLAVLGTGSAPGVTTVAARLAVEPLDTCDTILTFVWEGTEVARFQPFWWSPVGALDDMCTELYNYEDGELVDGEPFGNPVYRQYSYMPEKIRFVDHDHEEQIFIAFNADTHFKGCRNSQFKYGGVGIEFSEPLYRAGLLSKEPEMINGREVVPYDVILAHIPPAPKYPEEIKAMIDEGVVCDNGCIVVEAYGKKNGVDTLVEVHVGAMGLVEAYEKMQLTAEMAVTGQGGFTYARMFAADKFEQTGLITTDMLSYPEIETFREYAKDVSITFDVIEKRI